MATISLKEDMHTYSRFSRGFDELLENLRAAEARGLERLAFTDHVQHTTTWLPHYVETINRLRGQTPLSLVCGVETTLLDGTGHLNLPNAPNMSGIEYVFLATHAFPLGSSVYSPTEIQGLHAEGILTTRDVINALVQSIINAMNRYASDHQLVLTHLFSILPKMGFNEATDIRTEDIEQLAHVAKKTGTFIDLNEHWKSPNLKTLKIFADHGIPILCGSGAHHAKEVGTFAYNRQMAAQFDGLSTSNDTEVTTCAFPSFAAE